MPTAESPIKMQYKLTQYSHGAGCGCKISPKLLDNILKTSTGSAHFPQLLVGNEERDDAAVFDLGDGTAIISTTGPPGPLTIRISTPSGPRPSCRGSTASSPAISAGGSSPS
jgi:selenophosphate synthase